MNARVILRFSAAHSLCANHDYKRAGIMRLAAGRLCRNDW